MNPVQKCEFCPQSRDNYYTCPKCNAAYCSLNCYRSPKHLQCSETFYKQCIEDEMKLVAKEGGLGKDTVKKTYEALIHNAAAAENEEEEPLDSDDDDNVADIMERLEGIDLDDSDAVWNSLTENEKTEFQALMKSGEISKYVPDYKPWWDHYYSSRANKKVRVIGEDDDLDKESMDQIVAVQKRIPVVAKEPVVKIKDLMGGRSPSPNVKFGLFNVIYAYAFTNRFFRGDIDEQHLSEFKRILFNICGNLRAPPQNFDSSEMALESAVSSVVANGADLEATQESAKAIKKDVFKIVRGPGIPQRDNLYLLVALSDLQGTMKKSLKISSKQEKQEIKLAMKKIDFYLAWVAEFYDQLKK